MERGSSGSLGLEGGLVEDIREGRDGWQVLSERKGAMLRHGKGWKGGGKRREGWDRMGWDEMETR